MNTAEKEEYLLQQLANCTDAQRHKAIQQMHRAETYNTSPKDFQKWVADTKKQFDSEATPDEISAVFNHLRV